MKRDFATRLSPQTLEQLDELVRQGRYGTRTEAIEEAVRRLFEMERRDPERLRRAFERASGAIEGAIDSDSWRIAELDRLEWEASRVVTRPEQSS